MQKTCKICGETTDISNFNRDKSYKDGYESKCKKCRKNARKKHKNICKLCGKEFENIKKSTKYCSKECQSIAHKNRVVTKCSYCDKKIEIVRSKEGKQDKYYCNQKCRTEHLKELMKEKNNPNYNRIKHNCNGCGKLIFVIPYRLKTQKYIFCSNECYKENIGEYFTGENNSFYNHKTYICEWCSKLFKRTPGQNRGKHVFCSQECYLEYNRIKERTQEVEVKCAYCDKKFKIWKSRLNKSERIYCSIECKNKGWGKYYSGENSPAWNPSLTDKDRILQRHYPEYYKWRDLVYSRDEYICKCCGDNRGHNLNAHHIYNYMEHEELRLEVNNGITLCDKCHKEFHDTYGYTNNNKEQLEKFLNKH
ncbi:hypothetical protein [uncultured Clostridium sp.]|uniref:hypothetical protein n=1 Tax=uncultured Clostridium sp. TaxID=59620 RepID=UPI0028E7E3F8|nr:hypothetical protein [uncultured Clostridium sp.]